MRSTERDCFGLGGVQVEVLRDVAFRVAPLTDRDVEALLHGVRGLRLLKGYRGAPAADLPALRDVLHRVSATTAALPELKELDLNPVIVGPQAQGCRLVDVRIKVGP
jgi:acyl-CoA synthetase (NDP forming)